MSLSAQEEFLLEEYRQLHATLAGGNQSIAVGLRLFATAGAAAVGAVLVSVTRGLAGSDLALVFASTASFLFFIATIGSLLLIFSMAGIARMLRSINDIRRYFLELNPDNSSYFRLPTTSSVPRFGDLTHRKTAYSFSAVAASLCGVSAASWAAYRGGSPEQIWTSAAIATLAFSSAAAGFAVIARQQVDASAGPKLSPRK